jgi:hypothetical protein
MADDLQCKITYDLEPGLRPAIGEYLVSQGKRGPSSAYLITGIRLIKPRKPRAFNRWMLTCQRSSVADLIQGDRFWSIYWYPRDRKRQPKRLRSKLAPGTQNPVNVLTTATTCGID